MRPNSSHDTQTIENLLKTEKKADIELSNEIWKLKKQNKIFLYIMGSSRDTLVVQNRNKTIHAMSKRKISNSATQTR